MKHLKVAMVCLGLALTVMVVNEAEAGRIKKPAKGARTEKTEEEMQPRRFDRLPSMQFMSGTLTRDPHSGWKIGETPLYLSSRCVITTQGSEEGMLEEGAKAVVMGSMVGGAISAWTVNVSQPDFHMKDFSQGGGLKEAGENPNVGEFLQRPE